MDDAAASLERLTRDPMADAYHGTARVITVSEPPRHGGYRPCTLDLEIEAEGLPPEKVSIELIFSRAHWPMPGRVVPARISRHTPREVEADWERITR